MNHHFNVSSSLGLGLGLDDPGQVGNTECLYTKIQRIYLKSRSKEERQRDLRVTVEILTGISPVSQQNLSLQITDDDDPFFLYALLITEDDFKTVKVQQGLLVDFDNFPGQFVRLLEHCKSANESQGPKFLLILDEVERDSLAATRQTHLKIVETNNFKHLCHLDLKIGGGSDAEVKKLMAFKIRQLKDTMNRNDKQFTLTNSQLNDSLRRLELKCREVEELQQQWGDEKNELLRQNLRELTKEREKLATAQLEWQRQTEKDKKEIKIKHENITSNLESQIHQLTSQNHILFEKNCQAESSNREKSSQIEALEKDLTNIHREVSVLRKQNSKLDLDYHEKEKLASNFRTKIAVTEQEIKDKSILINKQQELLRVANEQKVHLEESLHEKECKLQRKQIALKNLSDELIKANEILTKLQTDVASLKGKLKVRTDIALEQEQLLETKQKELLDLRTKVTRLEQQIKDFEISEEKTRESLKAAETKIEAKDKQLKNNDNVIHWLNRQLSGAHSELHSSQQPGFSSTPVFQPFTSKRRSALDIIAQSRPTVTAITPKYTSPTLASSVDPKNPKRVPVTENKEPVSRSDAAKSLKNDPIPKGLPTFIIQPGKKTGPTPISSAYFPKSTSPTSVN